MGFNPLKEKGLPIDKQFRNWTDLTGYQYDKKKVDPYTRCRVIIMNGAEFEANWFMHQMARHTKEDALKRRLALTRRAEQHQQKAISGLTPGNESNLEVTIGYEQVAVDLTAYLAQTEPDPYVKAALDFALLEDFDHLYRYANLLDMLEGKKAEEIVGRMTEITPGRPTISEHRHPLDSIRKPYDAKKADILTQLHCMIIVAGEQQTMNYYMNTANRYENEMARALWTEIGMIEEQHVSHYESLMDPTISWYKCLVMHEYCECYLYHSFMEQEPDPKIKKLWELHLDMEINHLHDAIDIFKEYEKKDVDFLPKELPEPLIMQSNIDYVREILGTQMELTAKNAEYVPVTKLPKDDRYYAYQAVVNEGKTPTQDVIKDYIKKHGQDYRFETKPHPVKRFQNRKEVPPVY